MDVSLLCWGSSPASITSHIGHRWVRRAESDLWVSAGNLPVMSDDWLYGRSPGGRHDDGQPGPSGSDPDATRPVPRQPRPDETRVMPTVPRAQSSTAPATTSRPTASPTPPRPVPPPPPPNGGSTSGSGWRPGFRPRFRLRYLWIVLALWLVYLVAVPFYRLVEGREGRRVPSGSPTGRPGGHQLPSRRQRLAQGPHGRAAQAAPHRQRRRPAHRHHRAGAHRGAARR